MNDELHEELSAREVEILQAIADGETLKQTARRLWLSEETVKTHRTKLYWKLLGPAPGFEDAAAKTGTRNAAAAAVAIGFRRGILK